MPRIDTIVDFMLKQQGEKFILQGGQKCVLEKGGSQQPTNQTMSTEQIAALIGEIVPAEQQATWSDGGAVKFTYRDLTVSASRSNGETTAVLSTDDGGAEPSGESRVEVGAEAAPESGKRVEHLDELFWLMKEMEASDLHLSSDNRPRFRVHGVVEELPQYEHLTHERVKELLWQIVPERNREEWEQCHDSDFAYELAGANCRFRCNIFMDRKGPGGVFRLIPTEIVPMDVLGLPPACYDLCLLSKGLVVVTGPTGSGKSTSLAAMVHYINSVRDEHMITIEDPIEFVHENMKCLVNQREVHVHTESFSRALRAGLREDPDIILVGEMRDLETIALAIESAETGHLVFGTLHTTTAPSTVDRIIEQFPPTQQAQIRAMLSESLKAVLAQTLCKKIGGGRAAAFELLLCPASVSNLIREGKTYQLPSIMQVGKGMGMVTMNDALLTHVKNKIITPEEAFFRAVDKTGMIEAFQDASIPFDPKKLETSSLQ